MIFNTKYGAYLSFNNSNRTKSNFCELNRNSLHITHLSNHQSIYQFSLHINRCKYFTSISHSRKYPKHLKKERLAACKKEISSIARSNMQNSDES